MAGAMEAGDEVTGPREIDVEVVPLGVKVKHREYQQALKGTFGDRCFEGGVEVLHTADRVVQRYTFEGRPQPKLQLGPKWLFPMPNRPVRFDWVEECRFQGPNAVSARAYLDLAALEREELHVDRVTASGSNEYLILVPGFLGFDAFGDRAGARIEYFDHVQRDILAARPDLAQHILVQRTLPTAAVEHRVKALFETVLSVLGAAWLHHHDQRKVVHLVGHSTGGLDAFLLTHPGYFWSGMTNADRVLRARMLDHIGTVVTLSAPLYGTPIARNFRGFFTDTLDVMFVLDLIRRLGRRRGPWQVPVFLATVLDRFVPLFGMFGANVPLLRWIGGFDAETAQQLSLYWGSMVADSQCIVDLAPERAGSVMSRLIDGGGAGFPRVRHYVTAAPRPELSLSTPLRSLAYFTSYRATADAGFTPRELVPGTWLVDDASFPRLEAPPRRNDGVVPSTSQAVPGNPTYYVEADHTDVVGHYEGEENTTTFRSRSAFTPTKHARLWAHIALELRAGEHVQGPEPTERSTPRVPNTTEHAP